MKSPRRTGIASLHPIRAIPGGRITIEGEGFPMGDRVPEVRIGGASARVVTASSRSLSAIVPPGATAGHAEVRVDGVTGKTPFVEVAEVVATGVHQVDNPAFDRQGNLYLTYSGARGEQSPVSVFRVPPGGGRAPLVSGIVNATSLAFDRQDRLHVSSRFDGVVYRIDPDGRAQPVASDLGVTCGLAFSSDDTLFVGDRSGTIFRVGPGGDATAFAMLPPSVAAFHLAFGPDGALYVTAPTLASRDAVYRIDRDGRVETISSSFGRPQGLAFDERGVLHVVEALAGQSGLYRLPPGSEPELVLAGASLIGIAFDPTGGFVVSSRETVYRIPPQSPPSPES